MIDTPQPLHGQCLCGAVQVELTPPRATIEACHCSMCRQLNSGGPFFSLAHVGRSALRVAGEDRVTAYPSSDWAERAFCGTCGASLWYHFIPGDHYSLAAGLFDLPADYALTEQIFIDEKPTWYDLAQDTPKKTAAETIAEAKEAGFDVQ